MVVLSMAIPYIGSKISLITTSDIRYEGILHTLNREESTIAVQNVRSFGTEGRQQIEVPMSNEIYDYIIFRGKDVKDLQVLQSVPQENKVADYGAPLGPTYESMYGSGGRYGCKGAHMGFEPPYNQNQLNGHSIAGARAESPCRWAEAMSLCNTSGAPRAVASAVRPSPPQFSPAAAGVIGHGGGLNGATIATIPPPQQQVQAPMGGCAVSQAEALPAANAAGPFRQPAAPLEPPAAAPICVPERRIQEDPVDRGLDPKTRGRGKTNGQKKQLSEVFRLHKRAEEIILKSVRSSSWSTFTPAALRALSETNPSVFHFYLDYINDCCPSHTVQSDEQQWELLCKALKKHFEKDFSPSQPPKPAAPARPNNTLGDFIMIQTDSRAAKKAAKAGRSSIGTAAKVKGGKDGVNSSVGGGAAVGGAQLQQANGASGGVPAPGLYAAVGATKGDKEGFRLEQPGGDGQDSSNGGASTWSCPRCTFVNESAMVECGMCGTSKAQAAMWAEFPPL